MNTFTRHAAAMCSIAAISVVAYFPVVDNSFISDDFGIFPLLEALEQNPSYIFDATSELFRATSYAYFWILFRIFGSIPEPYYWAGIGLHALVSMLVYALTLRVTGNRLAAWTAALFFAAYERHHEAVMWISGVNETILTLSGVLFLVFWEYAISRGGPRRLAAAAAFVVLTLALFSKEAAVVLAPAAILSLALSRYRPREVFERSIPVMALLAAWGVLWLSQADRNFFVTDGHYSLGLHFVPVYARALIRLSSPAIPLLAALFLLRNRKAELPWNSSSIFFAALFVMAIVPYSFLTYQDHIPSRHTYLPSVGLAGLVGIFFAGVHARLGSRHSRQICASLFVALVAGNIAYIWLKKEPQFRERAAPTRELILILDSQDARGPFHVCGFPLERPWWFGDLVSRFTPVSSGEVILQDDCVDAEGALVLSWDSGQAQYKKQLPREAASEKPR